MSFPWAAVAYASCDDNRIDWNCSGLPRRACDAPTGDHTYGRVIAVNTSSAYRKCAKLFTIYNGRQYTYRKACYEATYVYLYASEAGLPEPNCGNQTALAAVGNDTDARRGLRGIAFY